MNTDDPGYVLEIAKESGSVEAAAKELGASPEYLQTFLDQFEPDGEEVDIEAFPLASKEAFPVQLLPAYLQGSLPKKTRGRWPGGAKSPSWFKKISMCARNHSQRYRHKRPDPSGLDALVGNACHGAYQDAGLLRLNQRRGVPAIAGHEELLFLLERQPEVVHDRGTEVLRRARSVISGMEKPLNLDSIWGAEFVWSFQATAGMLIAGIADLIRVYADHAQANGPPRLVVITDYKTGPGQVPSRDDLRSDPQACLQLIWARRYFPSAKRIQFHLWNVTQNEEVTIDWDHELEQTTLSFVRACWHLWGQKYEKPNVGNHCRYCPYRSDCKGYNEEMQREAYRPKEGDLATKELDELLEIYYRARLLADLADTRRKDAGPLIMEKFGLGQKSYRSNRFLAMKKSRTNESFTGASDTLFKLSEATGIDLGHILDSCTTIGPQKLSTWIKTLPTHKQEVARALVQSQMVSRQSPPWVEVREKHALF